MSYSLKDDVEQLKKNMAQLHVDMQYNDSCQGWNREMTDLVNEYKREEAAWYNSAQITENGFQTTTQNLWYAHYLNKRRLRTLGLTARYDRVEPTAYMRGENERYPHWRYSHDGKNLICKISDVMRYKKSFFDQNGFVWADEGRGMPGEYYILQSRSVNGNYICPNCGHEDTLENLMDGCDYCRTKFQIEDLQQKVSSVFNPGSKTQERSGFTLKKNFVPLYVILVIVVFGLINSVGYMGGAAMLLMPLVGFVAIAIFLAVLMGKTSKESIDGGPARTRQTLEKIRSVDPHFSEETFIGILSNKLMSICYAESDAQIRPFVECDVMPFMATHRNIMDCKMIECVLMDYQTVEDYQYLNVSAKIGLTTYNNGRAFKTEAHLRMGLVKSIRAVTQSISDVNVYRCTSCGGSLSLLNGGRCEYCGNCLDLKEYDWVIERFEDITGKRAAGK